MMFGFLQRIFLSLPGLGLSTGAQASEGARSEGSIIPGMIDIPGIYELVIPATTFQDDPAKMEAYLADKEVVFSRLISTRVHWVRIDPPALPGDPFLLRTFVGKKPGLGSHAAGGESAVEPLAQFEARLVHGLRGAYCSLEIEGVGPARAPEYYLVLGVGIKGEQSLWLGPPNTPAEAPGGKNIQFILFKVGD